jgi:hypothetical protein
LSRESDFFGGVSFFRIWQDIKSMRLFGFFCVLFLSFMSYSKGHENLQSLDGLEGLELEGVAGVAVPIKVSVAGFASWKSENSPVYGGGLLGPSMAPLVEGFAQTISGTRGSVWVLKLEPRDGKTPFWLDSDLSSSMSQGSFRLLTPWLAKWFDVQGGGSAELGFSSSGSLLAGLLGAANRRSLQEKPPKISDFIVALMEDPQDGERVTIDRPHWSRGRDLDSWTWLHEFFFLVDATPFSGPERLA